MEKDLIPSRDMSLPELVSFLKSVNQSEDYADEYEELNLLAESLTKGKIDRVAQFRDGLKAHIEAAQKRLSILTDMQAVVDSVVKSVLDSAPDRRLEGETYVFRLQKNSRASVVLEDEQKITDDFRDFVASIKVDGSDKKGLAFVAGVILGRVVEFRTDLTEEEKSKSSIWYQLDISDSERGRLQQQVLASVRKSKIETALKEGQPVSGARLEQGFHLRQDILKVKKQKVVENG